MSIMYGSAAVILASGTIFGFLHPVTYTVIGDPPFEARLEAEARARDFTSQLVQLRNDANKTFSDVTKQLEQLDARQQQSVQRGQSVANQLISLRILQLRRDISEQEDKLRDNQSDTSARALLLRLQEELRMLERGEMP